MTWQKYQAGLSDRIVDLHSPLEKTALLQLDRSGARHQIESDSSRGLKPCPIKIN